VLNEEQISEYFERTRKLFRKLMRHDVNFGWRSDVDVFLTIYKSLTEVTMTDAYEQFFAKLKDMLSSTMSSVVSAGTGELLKTMIPDLNTPDMSKLSTKEVVEEAKKEEEKAKEEQKSNQDKSEHEHMSEGMRQ
jgi:hypothetical protein